MTFFMIPRVIYNAVLQAQKEVFKGVKPGANWGELHLVAERTIVKHLHQVGIVIGDLEEINKARVGSIFFPVKIFSTIYFSTG